MKAIGKLGRLATMCHYVSQTIIYKQRYSNYNLHVSCYYDIKLNQNKLQIEISNLFTQLSHCLLKGLKIQNLLHLNFMYNIYLIFVYYSYICYYTKKLMEVYSHYLCEKPLMERVYVKAAKDLFK